MADITITCPRCKNNIQVPADKGLVVCPDCDCHLLLRDNSTRGLDPAGFDMGVQDALGSNAEKRESDLVNSILRDDPSVDGVDDALKKGDVLLQRNQFNQALQVFKNAAVTAPDDYRAWWGLTTATLQHLCAYLEGLQLLTNVSPIQNVYDRQMKSAERSMGQVRLLAPEEYIGMLEERYAYETEVAKKDLKTALRACRKNARKRSGAQGRTVAAMVAFILAAVMCTLGVALKVIVLWRIVFIVAAVLLGLVGVYLLKTR